MNDGEVGGDARLPPERRLALQDELDELAGDGRLVMSLLSACMMGVVGLFMLAMGVLALTAETASTILAVVAICIGALGIVAAGWAAKDPFAQLRQARAITQDLDGATGSSDVQRRKGLKKVLLVGSPSDIAVRSAGPILGGVALFIASLSEPVLIPAIFILVAVALGVYAVVSSKGAEEPRE